MGKSRADRYYKHLKRSDRFVEQKRFKRALRELRDAHRLFPHDPLAWARLGHLYVVQDRFAEAVAAYEMAVPLWPEDLRTRRRLADCLEEVGRTTEPWRNTNSAWIWAIRTSGCSSTSAAPWKASGRMPGRWK